MLLLPPTKRARETYSLRFVKESVVRDEMREIMRDNSRVLALAQDAVSTDYALCRIKEWAKIEELLAVRGAANVTMNGFLAICVSLAPRYTESKLEKMRAALVWRQLEELDPGLRWSRDELFRVRFKGAKKACKAFKARGALSETKLQALVEWLLEQKEHDYARGMVVTFYGLLRHSDLIRLRPSDVEFGENEVLLSIIGGKGRGKEHVDEVRATEARKTLQAAVESAAMRFARSLFPDWSKERANELIRTFAVKAGWDPLLKWTMHSLRHGFAAHLQRSGISEAERKQRGRWSSSKVANWYARGD